MSDHEEGRSRAVTSEQWSHSQVRRCGVLGGGQASRSGKQVGWRNSGKVANQLELAVLLTGDIARLRDWGAVVVGSVASRVAKVTPVGTTEDLDVSGLQ